ncbi:tRNA dihydrouridine synthase DusB [Geoalkalibacter halelectricus]|uniref:tRNA-dihydrouridine synthase n=1 Tax=Geoalkalibacter halelectricus TaxID=2847045 RepID=A0ABY5ZQ81_9BACT|nr:tRNA dihydrouridine synthase DusB [Geoalkalibacter halelectricus]MDO3377035.1 tRNA dihydrouridine synthase DusB [Geoalkalibacter halelectricus]UWZ81256.1 tRNA dihydrouridine synthase DusB [Geoalkalibacter halelectricus]
MRIGSLSLENNLFLAPMAGISDLPYRRIMKDFGAGLVFSEMVSANGLVYEGRRTRELLRTCSEEGPLAVQIFGSDPDILARAAALVENDGALLDINMGCPVRKVVRSGAGSALMREPPRVAAIVRAVRRVTARPLTVKIRSGWDGASENFLEIGRIAQEEGADAVTLHPRSRAQGFSGKAAWEHIRALKRELRIPVIGSGDVFAPADAYNMLEDTGCDAVMVGRGGYGNPWLLGAIRARERAACWAPPARTARLEVVLRHFDLHLEQFGPLRTLGEMRKHLCWYSRGLGGASNFRALVNSSRCVEELRCATHDFFLAEC